MLKLGYQTLKHFVKKTFTAEFKFIFSSFYLQENKYQEACQKFTQAMQVVGYTPDLSYNIALCHYMMKQYAPALKHIADIIERGIREHPGMAIKYSFIK